MSRHICHVSSVHSGLDIRIARKEALAATLAGFRTSLVITASHEEVEEGRRLGIEVMPIPSAKSRSRVHRLMYKARYAMATALGTGADLIHVHDPELLPYAVAASRNGPIIVMDVHEDLRNQINVKAWINPAVRPLVANAARKLERFAAARLDAVVTVSPVIAGFFEDVARRVVVVRNFASKSEFDSAQSRGGWEERKRVCYVGGISIVRGILGMVRALPLAGVRMLLAGEFHSEAEKDLVMKEPGWQQVDYLGTVDRKGIAEIFSQSFAGMLTLHPTPNHVSGYAIKMFEYMAAGLPVITSPIPSWQAIVESERCGIVANHDDPAMIAAAILQLKTDPQFAMQLGENGRRAVASRYNWESESEVLIELYRTLLHNRA